jgi:hypothetical protein
LPIACARRRTHPTPDRLVHLHDICYTRPQIEALRQKLEDAERKELAQ